MSAPVQTVQVVLGSKQDLAGNSTLILGTVCVTALDPADQAVANAFAQAASKLPTPGKVSFSAGPVKAIPSAQAAVGPAPSVPTP